MMTRSTSIGRARTVVVALAFMMMPLVSHRAAAREIRPPAFSPGAGPSRQTESAGSDRSGREEFGIDDADICTIGFPEFLPVSSGFGWDSDTGEVGERWATGSDPYLLANVDCVPNGAEIEQLVFYGRDDSATADLSGFLVVYFRESGFGSTHGGFTLGSCSTSGAPGDTGCDVYLFHTVKRRGYWDGDGLVDVASYQVWAETPTSDVGKTAIAEVRIVWRRQVSPAPATATFSDVPVGSFGFQHIEALAASGITAGCGGGNFCPDAPLTRAQMAVFLAKALGLHWSSGL